MKKLLFITGFIAAGNLLSAQNMVLTDVVKVDSTDKNQLYSRAKEWFVYSFKSGKDVIQLDSKDDGKIIGKGNFKFIGKPFTSGTQSTGPVDFTVTIEVKDGKYRYSFEDFHHSDLGFVPQKEPKGMMKAAIKDLWKDTQKEGQGLITSLAKYMTDSTKNNSKSKDW